LIDFYVISASVFVPKERTGFTNQWTEITQETMYGLSSVAFYIFVFFFLGLLSCEFDLLLSIFVSVILWISTSLLVRNVFIVLFCKLDWFRTKFSRHNMKETRINVLDP